MWPLLSLLTQTSDLPTTWAKRSGAVQDNERWSAYRIDRWESASVLANQAFPATGLELEGPKAFSIVTKRLQVTNKSSLS